MSRSLALASLLSLACIAGCTAQEEKRDLQNSVQQLQQRLERMDEYLRSLQNGQVQQDKQRTLAIQEAQQESVRLRDQLAQRERDLQLKLQDSEHRRAELEQASGQQRAALEQQMTMLRADMDKRQHEFSAQLERLRKEQDEAMERTRREAQ